MKFRGILFDLDGTLIDSLAAVDRAWSDWAREYNLEPEQVLEVIHGRPARESVSYLLQTDDPYLINQAFEWIENYEATDTEGTIPLPGSIELLEELNQRGIPWAIVTSGTMPVASARIKAAGLPEPSVLVTPELLNKGKPDPEPYHLGAEKLGLEASDCLVFEDAPAGVTAGHKAGAHVLAMKTHFKPEQLPEADQFLDSLTQVEIQGDGPGYQLEIKPHQ